MRHTYAQPVVSIQRKCGKADSRSFEAYSHIHKDTYIHTHRGSEAHSDRETAQTHRDTHNSNNTQTNTITHNINTLHTHTLIHTTY